MTEDIRSNQNDYLSTTFPLYELYESDVLKMSLGVSDSMLKSWGCAQLIALNAGPIFFVNSSLDIITIYSDQIINDSWASDQQKRSLLLTHTQHTHT